MSDNAIIRPSDPMEVPATATSLADPKAREKWREELRATEWAMHQKLIAAAQTALDNFLANPHRITAQDITRLTELGLELGRSACGLTGPQAVEPAPRGPFISLEFRAAIQKIYGQPVPAQFIDVESESETLPPN